MAVAEGKDEQVGELVFLARDITEGHGLTMLMAEVGPGAKDLTVGGVGLACGGFRCKLQSRAKISLEEVLGSSWHRHQGLGCG